MVNAESSYFRRRIFANLFSFQVDFYVSKIPLNIWEYLILTKEDLAPAAHTNNASQIIA